MKASMIYAQLLVLSKVLEENVDPDDEMVITLSNDEFLEDQIARIIVSKDTKALSININSIDNVLVKEEDNDGKNKYWNSSMPS